MTKPEDGVKNQKRDAADVLSIGDKVGMPPGVFVAIDLEIADHHPGSACALGAVRVENGVVTAEEYRLIKPPREAVTNARAAGIDMETLKKQPGFGDVWPGLAEILDGADYIIAHNVNFDKTVIAASCKDSGQTPPDSPFLCTLKGARSLFGKGPHPLAELCQRFAIPMRHHDALSDAKAAMKVCAELSAKGALLGSMHVDPIDARVFELLDDHDAAKTSEEDAVKEFTAIANALTCDDALSQAEFEHLHKWLTRHKELAESPSLAPVFSLAATILQDGEVDENELASLKALLSKCFN